jgi:hypothetical protein
MCRQRLVKLPNIKLHENPISGFGVVTCIEANMAERIGVFLQHCERDKTGRTIGKELVQTVSKN